MRCVGNDSCCQLHAPSPNLGVIPNPSTVPGVQGAAPTSPSCGLTRPLCPGNSAINSSASSTTVSAAAIIWCPSSLSVWPKRISGSCPLPSAPPLQDLRLDGLDQPQHLGAHPRHSGHLVRLHCAHVDVLVSLRLGCREVLLHEALDGGRPAGHERGEELLPSDPSLCRATPGPVRANLQRNPSLRTCRTADGKSVMMAAQGCSADG